MQDLYIGIYFLLWILGYFTVKCVFSVCMGSHPVRFTYGKNYHLLKVPFSHIYTSSFKERVQLSFYDLIFYEHNMFITQYYFWISYCHFCYLQVQLTVTPREEGVLQIVGVKWKLSGFVVGFHNFDTSPVNMSGKQRQKANHPRSINLKFAVVKVHAPLLFFYPQILPGKLSVFCFLTVFFLMSEFTQAWRCHSSTT